MDKAQGFASYLAHIKGYAVLEPQEEAALFERYHAGDAQARDRLIEANLRFVAFIAREFLSYGHPLEDIVAEGNLGLLTALKRFDPARGVPFASYAFWWVRRQIQRYIAANVSMVRPPSAITEKRLFGKGWQGETPPVDLSLDAEHGIDAGASLLEILSSSAPTPEQSLLTTEQENLVRRTLEAELSRLSNRDRLVIERRLQCENPALLREVAQELGLSREGVRKVELKVIKRLKDSLGAAMQLSPSSAEAA